MRQIIRLFIQVKLFAKPFGRPLTYPGFATVNIAVSSKDALCANSHKKQNEPQTKRNPDEEADRLTMQTMSAIIPHSSPPILFQFPKELTSID
jgi:hypothetical protein